MGIIVFGLAIFNGFVWDDEEQVVGNMAIRNLANIPFFFTQSTFNSGGTAELTGMYFKPLMTVFFSLIYQFSGDGAWGFHLVQIFLHILNSGLIYLLFKKFVRKEWAIVGSLLFLVHPGNVESVVYVSGLQDVLFMTFGLLALWVSMRKELNNRDWVYLGFLLFLSVLSKESGVLFLFALFFYFWFFKKRELKTYFMLLSLLVSGYLILRYGIAGVGLNHNKLSPIMLASPIERLMTLPTAVFYYLRLCFFPANLAISQHWVVKEITISRFWLPLILDIFFGLALLWINLKYKLRELWFFGLLLMFGLGMHSQIVPLDMTASDRWLYFPLFAFLGLLVIIVDRWKNPKHTAAVCIVGFVLVMLFSLRSFVRVLDWRDGLTLFTHDEPLARGNFDFENNLGVYLFRDRQYKQAKVHYLRSIQVAPHWWTNWNNLGVIYALEGKLDKARECYLRAIKNGDYYIAYENYISLLLKKKKNRQALKFLTEKALPRFPYNQKLQQMYQYLTQKSDAL